MWFSIILSPVRNNSYCPCLSWSWGIQAQGFAVWSEFFCAVKDVLDFSSSEMRQVNNSAGLWSTRAGEAFHNSTAQRGKHRSECFGIIWEMGNARFLVISQLALLMSAILKCNTAFIWNTAILKWNTENVDMVWRGERKERISYKARTPNSSAYSFGLDEMSIFLKPENSSWGVRKQEFYLKSNSFV